MQILNVEKCAFDMMMARFESFTQRVEQIINRGGDKSLNKWLDNQDVCQILNIKSRCLQTYRDNGTLPFTQIGYKMYYRPEDIDEYIKSRSNG